MLVHSPLVVLWVPLSRLRRTRPLNLQKTRTNYMPCTLSLLVHKPDHWIAIRQNRGSSSTVAWMLDSVNKGPRPLSAAAFRQHLAQYPETYQIYTEKG